MPGIIGRIFDRLVLKIEERVSVTRTVTESTETNMKGDLEVVMQHGKRKRAHDSELLSEDFYMASLGIRSREVGGLQHLQQVWRNPQVCLPQVQML